MHQNVDPSCVQARISPVISYKKIFTDLRRAPAEATHTRVVHNSHRLISYNNVFRSLLEMRCDSICPPCPHQQRTLHPLFPYFLLLLIGPVDRTTRHRATTRASRINGNHQACLYRSSGNPYSLYGFFFNHLPHLLLGLGE